MGLEFESLIYVPQKAWALKHQSFADEYPHTIPFCIETGSNPEGWKYKTSVDIWAILLFLAVILPKFIL